MENDKTNKMLCAPSEDADQPGHPPSLICVFAVRLKKAWLLSYPFSDNEDSDQTGRMPRLIWVFAGPACHFAGFVLHWLICEKTESLKALRYKFIKTLIWIFNRPEQSFLLFLSQTGSQHFIIWFLTLVLLNPDIPCLFWRSQLIWICTVCH